MLFYGYNRAANQAYAVEFVKNCEHFQATAMNTFAAVCTWSGLFTF